MAARDHRPATPPSTVTLACKRALDLAGATVGLVLLAPLFAIIAVAIRLETPGPALFRQTRVGRGGHSFRIFKFRSMHARQPLGGSALTVQADQRVTRIGALLRRTKLDELPQLINVLVGDMSLVGPRPEVPEFMAFYTPEQQAVLLSMRPGMTDYAAILFRDESAMLTGEQDPIAIYRYRIMPIKYGYYERYSHEIGAINDLRIIIATILLLLIGHLPRVLGIESELQTFTRETIAG